MHLLKTHIAKEQKTPIRIQEYAVGIFNTVATISAIKKAIKKKLKSTQCVSLLPSLQ